jgi:hypothetical protein
MASVLALSRAEGEAVKRTLRYRFTAHLLTLAIAAAALFVETPAAYYLALAALIAQLLAWWLRHRAGQQHARAEEGRRRALLITNLGTDRGQLDTVDLTQRFTRRALDTASAWEDDKYSATVASPGPSHLRDSLQESAF